MNGLHPFKKFYTQKMGAQQKYTPPPPPAKKSAAFPKSKTALFRTDPYTFSYVKCVLGVPYDCKFTCDASKPSGFLKSFSNNNGSSLERFLFRDSPLRKSCRMKSSWGRGFLSASQVGFFVTFGVKPVKPSSHATKKNRLDTFH